MPHRSAIAATNISAFSSTFPPTLETTNETAYGTTFFATYGTTFDAPIEFAVVFPLFDSIEATCVGAYFFTNSTYF